MSQPFVFQDTPVDEILIEAYQRVKGIAQGMTGYEAKSSLNSLNYILTSWVNIGINLATVHQHVVGINPGVAYYNLPTTFFNVKGSNAYALTMKRQLTGASFSSAGGDAGNAFDGNPGTACTQTAADGYIQFTFTKDQSIPYVGVLSAASIMYTLAFEYSYDGMVWYTANTPKAIQYPENETIWYVVTPSYLAKYWRIRETGGAILNIEELYFSTNQFQKTIAKISQGSYLNYTNREIPGEISSFTLFRSRIPQVAFWQTPDTTYNGVLFNIISYFDPVTDAKTPIQIPQRYIDALVAQLAFSMAVKTPDIDPTKYQALEESAKEAYVLMASQDGEQTDLTLMPWGM